MRAPRLHAAALLLTALALTACGGKDDAAAPASPAAPMTTTPAAADPAPAASAPVTAPAATPTGDAADATDASKDAAAGTPPAAPAAPTPPQTPAAPPAPVAPPTGPAPREGTDYTLIDPPQPLNDTPGKIEIAEVFSYTCIHCARLDPLVPKWKATLPAQVDFVYVPMSHGAFEQIARGFHAAQALGQHDKTHTPIFKAMAEEHRYGKGTAEDVAALYVEQGLDEDEVLATMKSFGINATIARTRKAIERWAIESTPTLVVGGKYRVVVTQDRGHQGMLDTARWLALRELSGGGTPGATATGTNPAP